MSNREDNGKYVHTIENDEQVRRARCELYYLFMNDRLKIQLMGLPAYYYWRCKWFFSYPKHNGTDT